MAKSTDHDWVDDVTPGEVREMIERTFSFLVSDYSFSEPTDQSINTIVIGLSYSGKNLAIEPLVDRRDRFVETCIVRLKDGSRPKGWKLDSDGDQFMTRLFEAARDRKVERSKVDHTPQSPQQALQLLLDDEAGVLCQGFSDFLADDAQYFTDLNDQNALKAAAKAESDFFATAEDLFRAKNYSDLVSHLDAARYDLSKLWQARLTYSRKHA